MSGENRFQRPSRLRHGPERKRDAYPQTTDGEPGDAPPIPAGFDELEFPDEITLSRPPEWPALWVLGHVRGALARQGFATDMVGQVLAAFDSVPTTDLFFTRQAADTWYAGVPRGRRLVLRRI